MIVALIAGSLEDGRFPGRNAFPLIGRPMVAYPILAARHAKTVGRVLLTTDAPAIARIARHQGVEVIERPPELAGPGVRLEQVLVHAIDKARAGGGEIEAVVVLLANAPTVTAALIDQAVDLLRKDASLDAVTAVAMRNEFNPRHAYTVAGGLLAPHPAAPAAGTADAYFDASVLWALRPRALSPEKIRAVRPNAVIDPATQKIRPMVFEGHGDVDYPWQVPGVADWLRGQGFSEEATPYDREAAARPTPTSPRAARPGGHAAERRVLITTVPFGELDRTPLDLLEAAGVDYVVNPLNRKLTEAELVGFAKDFGVIIAGTEPNTRCVIEAAPHLKLISRVGVGLDSVDLSAARERGVLVSYTPEAPAPAVAELTVGLMISLLRSIPQSDRKLRQGVWHRVLGRRLGECVVGLVGVGRIGRRVIEHLAAFHPKRILANDLSPDAAFGRKHGVEWTDKETLWREADVISLHLPLTDLTRGLISRKELWLMKPGAVLVNAARGGIVDEGDLAEALRARRIAAAALDTFQQEPYSGELTTVENCVLTSHMGSMSQDCRGRMELEATQEALRFLAGELLTGLVPEAEYELQGKRKKK